MSSFFTIPGAQKKRKRASIPEPPKKRIATSKPTSKAPAKAGPAPKRRAERDDSISGSDSDELDEDDDASDRDESGIDSDASDHEGETAAERRLRLAERYLENVKKEVDVYGFDAEDIDRDLIAERLQEDVAAAHGKVYRKLALELDFDKAFHTSLRWNADNVNSVANCPPFAYTVSNDAYLTKWRIQDLPQDQWPQTKRGKKQRKPPPPPKKKPERIRFRRGDRRKAKDRTYKGHVGGILSVAASEDGKYVVTAGDDNRLVVYDAESLQPLRTFNHHRDAVTGLAFRKGTNQLYSCSKDRTVKVWDLDAGGYVESLHGHEDVVVDISALAQERAVTVGARDRTARLWKVTEETQLVFRGGGTDKKPKPGVDPRSSTQEGSMDRVAMIDDELFVTGSDNGSLALWSTQKKKPLFILPLAHGLDPPLEPTQASAEVDPDPRIVVPLPSPRWITALHVIPYSDLILSGSYDGAIRLWKLSEDKKKIEELGVLGGGAQEEVAAASHKPKANGVNGVGGHHHHQHHHPSSEGGSVIRGVVNEISTFERGERGRDGLCVLVAVGKEHRLGKWKHVPGGRNGMFVFEVPRIPPPKALTNGVHNASSDDDR